MLGVARGPIKGQGALSLDDALSLGADGGRLHQLLRECQHVALDGGPAWINRQHLEDQYGREANGRGADE